MQFLLLKYLHISAVAASFALFVVRGIWALRSYPPAPETWVRILPHAVDALLLASALAMLYVMPAKGWPGDWMTVKVALLVVYLVLSLLALKWATSSLIRFLAWTLALIVFLFITTVAVLHHPLGIWSIVH